MGYTHYWYTKLSGIPDANWAALTADIKKLLAGLPATIELAWEYDEPKKPIEISKNLVRFNGKGDEGHETFYFERKPVNPDYRKLEPECFAFCKTAYKPYDLAVCGALIVIGKHAGEFVKISSDGDESDWQPALKWVTAVMGDGYVIPLSRGVAA